MASKKLMHIHKALECLENFDVSSKDDLSDDGDLISGGRLVIYLQTTRVMETPMKIQEMKMSFSQKTNQPLS